MATSSEDEERSENEFTASKDKEADDEDDTTTFKDLASTLCDVTFDMLALR